MASSTNDPILALTEASDRAKKALGRLPQDDATFKQCLTNQETVHHVLETLLKRGGAYKRKKSTRILESFKRQTAWMMNISGAVDVAVQSSSGIACPIWAPIKFVLKASHDCVQAAEQILKVIQILSDNLPRLEIYGRLHDDSRFQVSLVNVFADILEFSADAHVFFSRRMPLRLGRLIGKKFEDEFGDVIARIEQRTRTIDATAGALSQEREAHFIKETQKKQQKDSKIAAMRWLQPSNVYECLQRNLETRTDETCEWILQHATFRNWMNDQSAVCKSRTLFIHGAAGCGKSVLASFLHNALQQTPPLKNVPQDGSKQTSISAIVLYFSFSASDMDRRTLASLARTLLAQILEHSCGDLALPLLEEMMARGSLITIELFNTLSKIIEVLPEPVKVIVDGIDECSDSKDDISKHLLDTFRTNPRWNLIMLGQSYVITKLTSGLQALVLHITSEINSDDMRAVVNHEIAQCTLLSASPVRENVFTALLRQADGMFLWAKLMLDYLGASLCDDEVLTRLSDLPNGLEESYTIILDRLMSRLDKYQHRLVSYLFSFVTACGRPLRFEEVQYAYALAVKPELPATQSKLESFLLRLQPEDIVDICAGLLTFSNGVFRLVHNSVRDFLTRPEEDWNPAMNPRLYQLRVDTASAHRLLGDICLRYFLEVDFSQLQWEHLTSLDDLDTHQPMLNYACLYLSYHINRAEISPGEIRDKVMSLLESDHFFFALECVLMHGINDHSMHLQVEVWSLIQTFSREISVNEILRSMEVRCNTEHTKRVSEFGVADPRTIRWTFCREALSSYLSELVGSDQVLSDDTNLIHPNIIIAETPIVTQQDQAIPHSSHEYLNPDSPTAIVQQRPARRTIQRTNISRSTARVKELLQVSTVLPLGRQFELIMRMLQHIALPRGVTDPIHALWEMIKQKAGTMPVLHLAAVTFFYHSIQRNYEAFEIGNVCLDRMDDRETTLKIVMRFMMGFVTHMIDEDELAIEHFEYSLPRANKVLGLTNDMWFNAKILLAISYERCDRYEDSQRMIETVIADRHLRHTVDQKRWISAYFYLGNVHYAKDNDQEAISAYSKFLDLYKEVHGGVTKYDPWKIWDALHNMANCYYLLGEYDSALQASYEKQKYASELTGFSTEHQVELRRFRAIIQVNRFIELGISQGAVNDALKDYIMHVCKKRGPEACRDAVGRWYSHLVGNNRYTPETALEFYEHFWAVYKDAHCDVTAFESPHPQISLGLGPFDLARLNQKAGRHIEARQLFQECLDHYTVLDNLVSDYEAIMMVLWIFLADSDMVLGNYILAARAARAAQRLLQQSTAPSPNERRLRKKIHNGVCRSFCQVWRSGLYSPRALFCREINDPEREVDETQPEVHNLRRVRSTSSLGHPRGQSWTTRGIDALLLCQDTEKAMRSLEPRDCICHIIDPQYDEYWAPLNDFYSASDDANSDIHWDDCYYHDDDDGL